MWAGGAGFLRNICIHTAARSSQLHLLACAMASASSVDFVDAVQHSDSVAEHSDSVAEHSPVDNDDDKYFPIFARLPGSYIKTLVLLPSVTVEQLKRLIYNEIGVPPAYADLWYGDAYLYDDNATMEQLGIEAHAEILIALSRLCRTV